MLLRNILSDLWLWLTGWPHLWNGKPHGRGENTARIYYKAGWNPYRFALMYATTYLAGTLLGYGVVSLSRVWYYRQQISPFAKFMTRLLDWLVPGKHGALTGPWLWGTASRRQLFFRK